MSDTDITIDPLLILLSRASRGVLSPKEGDRLRVIVGELQRRVADWKQAAGAGMTNTDNLRAERDALAAGVPLICSDERHKTKVFALTTRITELEAERDHLKNLVAASSEPGHAVRRVVELEATIARVRHLAERWRHTGDRKHGPCRELLRTLDQPQPTT